MHTTQSSPGKTKNEKRKGTTDGDGHLRSHLVRDSRAALAAVRRQSLVGRSVMLIDPETDLWWHIEKWKALIDLKLRGTPEEILALEKINRASDKLIAARDAQKRNAA